MKDWLKDATRSNKTEGMLLDVRLPDEIIDGIRLDTASSNEEADALMRRLRHIDHARSARSSLLPYLLGGGALLTTFAAAAAAVVVVSPQLLQLDASAQEVPSELALRMGHEVQLTPSIALAGEGQVEAVQVVDKAAELAVSHGLVQFQVSPKAGAQSLLVHADDVDVHGSNTVFTVQRLDRQVSVQVERGQVQLTQGAWSDVLHKGDTWRTGDQTAVASPQLHVPEPVIAKGPAAPAPPITETPNVVAVPTIAESPIAAPMPSTVDPCEVDAFSVTCARSRVKARSSVGSADLQYKAMKAALPRVEADLASAREVVQNSNTFLDQHANTAYADDVRAFRVRAAFSASRSAEVLKYADDYLANAHASHGRRADVQRWRTVSSLRAQAQDATHKQNYDVALPLWRDLVTQETGQRQVIARAWLGVCAADQGQREEARTALRGLPEEQLDPTVLARVKAAWQTLTD